MVIFQTGLHKILNNQHLSKKIINIYSHNYMQQFKKNEKISPKNCVLIKHVTFQAYQSYLKQF